MRRHHDFYVYIATNRSRTLYIGVTNDIERRMAEHRDRVGGKFTSLYRIDRLIYLESMASVVDAIRREKELNGWRRSRKIELIDAVNPGWRDLSL